LTVNRVVISIGDVVVVVERAAVLSVDGVNGNDDDGMVGVVITLGATAVTGFLWIL
jgi:hypothetical protein